MVVKIKPEQLKHATLQVDGEGMKFDADKVRLDLIPYQAIEQVARVLTFGAAKYGEYNWARGINYSRLVRAAINHLQLWFRGQKHDQETGISHLAHAACCILFLIHYDSHEHYIKNDDRVLKDLS